MELDSLDLETLRNRFSILKMRINIRPAGKHLSAINHFLYFEFIANVYDKNFLGCF